MLNLIVAPYHLGSRNVAVGAGPLRVLESRVAERTGASLMEIDEGVACDWVEVNRQIAAIVGQARLRGEFPLVLAGNCSSCLGTLPGIRDLDPGIIWFDAHGDFHAPETSISGSVEGMALMMAVRDFVPEHKVILAGTRDLDPGEDQRVRDRLFCVPDGRLGAHPALPALQSVYVHLDVDVLDPSVSPGANFQGPGGLTVEVLVEALEFIFRRFKVAALAIVNYNPENDPENLTRDIIAGLIDEIDRLHRDAANG